MRVARKAMMLAMLGWVVAQRHNATADAIAVCIGLYAANADQAVERLIPETVLCSTIDCEAVHIQTENVAVLSLV
jgi:hypothetical protein